MSTPIILDINAFANLCGHFFNVNQTHPDLPDVNNGYNCDHEDQEEGDGFDDLFIGACHASSCPLGYPPSTYDLKKYGVIDDDAEEEDESDYIVVTDVNIIEKLQNMGITGLATRSVEEAEAWEETQK